jgi:hypothetical protein
MKQLLIVLFALAFFYCIASCEKEEQQPKERTNCYGFTMVVTDFQNTKDSSTLNVDTITTVQCYFTLSEAEAYADERNTYTPYTTNDTIRGYFQTVCTFVKY